MPSNTALAMSDASARVGDGAVIDYQFNTTDVCIVLETEQVTQKYLRHYQQVGGRTAERVSV